ncbi:MAG: DNA polymerase III subunit epsilon [Nitrosomonadales bacterium]|nr:DNA polymerase III subunit epsilon [Nitrosomonadales bacterium]
MRQIVLDTETTGLYPDKGHRIIEVAALELIDRKLTGNHFHRYVNPEREVDEEAERVHGLNWEQLKDHPLFADIVPPLLEFIAGAELIIHNAPFDVGFLNKELSLLGLPPLREYCPEVLDTLKLAKDMHPGKKNSLNALCDRYEVDNSHRSLHGALLDTELLAEVYLAMTRGQGSLLGEEEGPEEEREVEVEQHFDVTPRQALRVLHASEEELARHAKTIEDINKSSKGKCVWSNLEAQA